MSEPTAEQSALRIRLETDRTRYAPGDSIRAQVTVSHRGGAPEVLEFGSSQRCDFEIRDAAGATLWRWSADRAFGQMMGEETLASGRPPLVCAEQLPAPQHPGRYQIVASLVARGRAMRAALNVTVATAISKP